MNFTLNTLFATSQKVGKSLMVPVSVLPAAGLLVALGRILQDMGGPDLSPMHEVLVVLGKLMFGGGLAIFENLPVIFAIGVAIGFTGGAGVAGLAAAVGYFTLINVLKVMSEVRSLDLAINTGVFGGIAIGLVVASLYRRFYQTKLHPIFGFFSGKRLVPIISAASAVLIGILLGLIWPPIQEAIHSFGSYVMSSPLGPAFYAAGKRLLIPVGLHHVYYPPFLFEFGQFTTEAGKILTGESPRYFAGDPTAGRFMASEFPIMLFGLPAACVAMYLRAPADKRKQIGGIMLSSALTSIITGITEPVEFSFIFVAPLLYIFHVVAAFCSGLLTSAFDIHLGYTFSASLIDYVVGFFNQKNSIYLWLVVGPIISGVYFTAFYGLIGWFDFKTPGRNEQVDDSIQPQEQGIGAFTRKAEKILTALGGSKNIRDIDACITRLRLQVYDPKIVEKDVFKALGASGTMATGDSLQIIFGTESDALKDEIKSLIKQVESVSLEKRLLLHAPINGEVLSLKDVPDPTFADLLLGDGFAIRPADGVVYAPFNAEVVQLFRTNHAIGLKSENGLEVLIHIGIDTVKLNGDGFKAFVKVGERVVSGQKLIEFDYEKISKQAKSLITPVVVTNMDLVESLNIVRFGNVEKGNEVINLTLKS
ncbi:MAG: glucose PTS transporter subunit IIA [Bdellovibrionota bacterium]